MLSVSEAYFAEAFSVLMALPDSLSRDIENLRTAARVDLA
jgi:hypothetical protein